MESGTQTKRQVAVNSQKYYSNCRAVLLTKFSVEPTRLAVGQIITALEAARFIHQYEKSALGRNGASSRNYKPVSGRPPVYELETAPLLFGSASYLAAELSLLAPAEALAAGQELYVHCIGVLKRNSVERPLDDQITDQDNRHSRAIPGEWNGRKFTVLEAARFVLDYEQNNAEPFVTGQRFEPLFGSWGGNKVSEAGEVLTENIVKTVKSPYLNDDGSPGAC